MLILPAIDLRGGKCVRLRQGDYAKETVFGDDPAAMARRWVEEGARYLHVVDLDGAKEGRPVNTQAIRAIVREAGAPCQLGGGLRSIVAIEEALALGVDRVILGTKAASDPEWFASVVARYPDRIVLGLDARNGMVATEGWIANTTLSALELARRYEELPLAAIVYTDVARDGMMQGPNLDAIEELALSTRHLVVASGGVASVEDVLALKHRGIGACILGRSIYEGNIKLQELFERLRAEAIRGGC